jgi:hypothetical protein
MEGRNAEGVPYSRNCNKDYERKLLHEIYILDEREEIF